MRFRQKSILFWECQIIISVCILVSVILMACDSLLITVLLAPTLLLVGVLFLQFIVQREYIIINERGVACILKGKLRWTYSWHEISELRIGNRFRNPAIEIILKSDRKNIRSNIETIDAYFQLGHAAKKAIALYCKCPITQCE